MPEIQHILILANSEREGGRCIAGKLAPPLQGKNVGVGQKWIRLNNPQSTTGGAVPYAHTLCRPPNRTAVRPFDIIKVTLLKQCNNPDHPEDWNYDPNVPWEWLRTANFSCLADIVDTPQTLWHDETEKSVKAGYIRTMSQPASLYLIKAPPGWTVAYYKDWIPAIGRDKKRRKLTMTFGGRSHEFSVTDADFDKRFNLPVAASQWPNTLTTLAVPNPDGVHFCLSLTGLTPPNFISHHYKICATIFEP